MGRLVARRTAQGNGLGSCGNSPIDEQFGYDARGLLVAAQNGDVGLIREYDALGRMVREIDTRFETGVGYAYDKSSRLTSKVYPDGGSVHYTYDGAGRTVGISDPFGATTRFVYDAAGRRIQKRGTDNVRTDYNYNATTRFLTSVGNNAPGLPFAWVTNYPNHDNVGNRLRTTGFGGDTFYTYDALDRLSSVDPPDQPYHPANGVRTDLEYDDAGNRTDFGPKSGNDFVSPHTTFTYSPPSKRLLTEIRLDGQLVESLGLYDPNGNPGSWTPPGSNTRTLKFDALGRLVQISSNGFNATYVYDPFGRRIEKTEQNVETRYQYDGLDVVAEYGTTQLEALYVFGPGIDEVLKMKRGGVEAAFHTDGLGSVVAISANGVYRNTYVYDAFGKIVSTPGQSQPFANAYTFTGRERDASGLTYYRARYYLPSAGRFLTPDPIGLEGGINAYAYVDSNPVNYTDPFGLRAGAPLGPAAPRLPDSAPFLAAAAPVLAPTQPAPTLRPIPGGMASSPGSAAAGTAARAVGVSTAFFSTLLTPSTANAPTREDQRGPLTLYRGTSYMAAMEVVAQQRFDVERIAADQLLRGKEQGVFLTTQLETARYFADLAFGSGRRLGPAVVSVTVEKELFYEFLVSNGIPFEMPVADMPGMRETVLPFSSLPHFQTLSPVFLHQE